MQTPDKATMRALAVRASCDPRAIEKVLRGEPVKGMAGHRARGVLASAGFAVTRGTVVGDDSSYRVEEAGEFAIKPGRYPQPAGLSTDPSAARERS